MTRERARPRRENADLLAQVEELRRRAEDAEETIRAIRSGEVDSLVVEGPDGPMVYALEGVNHAYRVLVEAMSEGAISVNEGGTILYANRRFAAMLGIPLSRVMGRPLADFVPPAHRSELQALLQRARRGESRGEVPLRTHDEADVPAYLSISAVTDSGRRVFCVVATDLRERKRHEQIVASEGLARSIIEQAADAIIVCDDRGRIIRANASAARLCGADALLGPFGEGFTVELLARGAEPPRPRRRAQTNLALAAIQGDRLTATPAVVRRRDGSTVDVLVSAAPLHGPGERVIGCVIVLVDVTEAKRAEEALRESEARFRSVLENSLDVAYRRDLRTGRLDYISPTVESLYGFTAEEMKAMSWEEMSARFHPDDLPAYREAMKAAERRGEFRLESRFRRKDGEYRWVATTAVIVRDERGRPRYRSGVIRDITEQKRREDALRAANLELAEADRKKNELVALLSQANEELERFAYVASHDLQEPLRTVSTFTEMIAERYRGRLDADADEFVGFVVDGVARMQRLIRGLLSYARLGYAEMKVAEVDPAEAVADALRDLQASIAAVGADVRVGRMHRVLADRTHLSLVFQNLIGNSLKFRSARAPRIHVGATRRDGEVVFWVADNGQGFDMEEAPRLFQVFRRLHGADYDGSGIGLANCKRIVLRHGGRIWCRSRPGRGSTFAFTIPAARTPEEAHART